MVNKALEMLKLLLHKGPIEIPTDIAGIVYIPFEKVENAFLAIKRELDGLGLINSQV